ncbi:MAG: CRISPR system precrRNA processing endoribonuclease RAMP protein Cas6 [Planctomycetota bacterium]
MSSGRKPSYTTTISLRTPLRIRFDGQITDSLEFHVLLRNLLRRISSLSYFHCGKKLDMDFRGLIEKSRAVRQTASDIHWYDWKRYSTRQEEWMSLGGVIGNVLYEGDMTDFMMLLRLGEYVHVGKGTSFGLGKYEVL